MSLGEREDVGVEGEFESALAVGTLFGDDRGQRRRGICTEKELRAGPDPFSWAKERPPAAVRSWLKEKDFDFAAVGRFATADPGGEDLGIVEDEEVAWAEEGWKGFEQVRMEGVGGSGDAEKAGIGTGGGGVLSDE